MNSQMIRLGSVLTIFPSIAVAFALVFKFSFKKDVISYATFFEVGVLGIGVVSPERGLRSASRSDS